MKATQKVALFLVLLALVALSGCSAKKQAVPMKVYWPPPPAEPKMEWITTFSSEDNFPKTDRQITAEKFLGKQKQSYLQKPMGVAADRNGLVYVADLDANNLQVIDFNKKTMAPFIKDGIVGLPIGLAFDSRGLLYVAEAYYKKVLVYNERREIVRQIGVGELEKPTFLAIDEGRGRLYVSDVVKDQIFVFDLASGDKLFAFGRKGGDKGELFGPQGLAIDKQGRIFVAEQFNARVQVFDPEGQHLSMFGSRGDKEFQFEGPRGLAFDSAGNLFVAEARKASLLVFQPDGTPLTSIGGGRTGHQLGFTLPTSVFIDTNDRVYVSDGLNRRITIWQMLTPAYLVDNPLNEAALQAIEDKVRRIQKEKDAQ